MSERRRWNTVASLTVVAVLVYLSMCSIAFFAGRIDAVFYKDLMLPVILPLLGYFARLLGESQ